MTSIIEKNGIVIDDIQGFNWIPLPLSYSNSYLINFFAFIERFFCLGKWYTQSPWLMVSVKKR